MEVKVKNRKTFESHTFLWLAARSPRINLINPADQTLEVPSSFLCKIEQPYRYVLVFNDRDTQDAMRSYLEEVIKKTDSLTMDLLELSHKPHQEYDSKLGELRNSVEYKTAYDLLWDQLFYWKPGEYEATLCVVSDKPKREFTTPLVFSLSDDDIKRLRLNIIAILENRLRQYFGLQPFLYHFAYPRDTEQLRSQK